MPSDNEVDPTTGITPAEKAAAAEAERFLAFNQLVMSGNQYQPKLVWTQRPWGVVDIKRRIEAGPFIVLAVTPIREAITWAGAPFWATNAYLVMVEVKATFGAR